MLVSPTLATLLAGCLLWTRHNKFVGALPAPAEESTTSIIHFETSTLLPGGDHCAADSDCGDPDLICDLQSLRCQCKDDTMILTPDGNCLTTRRLGEECQFASQCKGGNGHLMADCSHGVCACKTGFVSTQDANNSTTCVSSKAKEGTETVKTKKMYMDINMIIIIVVLAVMFLGMCVALHLFSRARFRNHRTIFNDPHPRLMHIKLGKKKRRTSHGGLHVPGSRNPSICSQLSMAGARSRAGSRAGSPTGSVRSLKTEPYPDPVRKSEVGAPIAKLDDAITPTIEDAKKDHNLKPTANGPDVVKEASVVQNGPNSPTIIVTNINGSRSSSEVHSPGSATRV